MADIGHFSVVWIVGENTFYVKCEQMFLLLALYNDIIKTEHQFGGGENEQNICG